MTARRRAARFSVEGRLDNASRTTRGTVTITPSGVFVVRPLRKRTTFELPLGDVATMVVQRLIRAEIFKKRLAKAARRR